MQREIKQAHNKEQRFRSDSGSDVGGKGVVNKLLYMVMICTVSGAALRCEGSGIEMLNLRSIGATK